MIRVRFHHALIASALACVVACDRVQTAAQGAPPQRADIISPSRTDLNLRYQQQEPMLCVPTAASIVMAYYGDPETPRKLKTLSRGLAYDPAAPFSDFTMTWYRDLIRGAGALGYAWSERDLYDDEAGFNEGLSLIRSELVSGHPVLLDVSLPAGHTLVAAGFDEGSRSLLVVDPNAPAPGKYAISYARLRDIWNEHAFGRHIRSLVISPPR